jgi:hypothetical protein
MKLAVSRVGALLLGATVLCNFRIHGTHAEKNDAITAAADQEDAEFWERFLGQTYKRKHRTSEDMSIPS